MHGPLNVKFAVVCHIGKQYILVYCTVTSVKVKVLPFVQLSTTV